MYLQVIEDISVVEEFGMIVTNYGRIGKITGFAFAYSSI
jgi:hypothetical protein